MSGVSTPSNNGAVHTINSVGMGRLHGKNAVVTGAAGCVIQLSFRLFFSDFLPPYSGQHDYSRLPLKAISR